MNLANVSMFCFLASYAVVFAMELTRLIGKSNTSRVVKLVFAGAGFVAHTAYLLVRFRDTALPPLLSSTQDWLLVLAWVLVLLYLILAAVFPDLAVGLYMLPLVLLLIVAAYFVSDQPHMVLNTPRPWRMLHAASLVLGMTGVLASLVMSMMYLRQHYRIRHKMPHPDGLKLPSLEKLARINRWAVLIAVPLLTLGMFTGLGLAVYAQGGLDGSFLLDPVVAGNGLVWLIMIGFFIRMAKRRSAGGRHVAWLTLWACGFLLVTLIGLQIVTEQTLH